MRALALMILLLFAPAALGQSFVANPHARIELIPETARPAPGQPLTLGIRIAPQPGWHSYWRNPGEAGAENRLLWTLPPGVTAAAPRYPVPEALLVQGIMNHVYSGPATLLVDIAVPAAARGALPIALALDYLVCSADLCVPERAVLVLALALTTGDGATDPTVAATFAAARAALPVALAGATFADTNGRVVLRAPIPGTATQAHFFPDADNILVYSAAQTVTRDGDALRLETRSAPGAAPARLTGVLRIETPEGIRGYALDAAPGAIAAAIPANARVSGADGTATLLPTLALAILGGLLLNVMPCVFPILSLKALALARGNTAPAAARAEARAYTGGVMAITTALGAAILLLRAGGAAVGWGVQLQDPRVILALFLLMTAIALNLAGLFEIEIGAGGAGDRLTRAPGAKGAFFTHSTASAWDGE